MRPDISSEAYKNAVSVQQMRDSDAYTFTNFVPSRELMYRAARGVFEALDWTGRKIAVFCGSGNNGGDGYALAGILADHGVPVVVFRVSEKFSDDGRYYHDMALQKGVEIQPFDENADYSGFDTMVDCIFGTGFHGMPREMAAAAIRIINGSGAFVLSVDINSGMNGDTGEVELAVKSDLTVSIGFYKKGHFLGQAPTLIRDLVNVDIGIILPGCFPKRNET